MTLLLGFDGGQMHVWRPFDEDDCPAWDLAPRNTLDSITPVLGHGNTALTALLPLPLISNAATRRRGSRHFCLAGDADGKLRLLNVTAALVVSNRAPVRVHGSGVTSFALVYSHATAPRTCTVACGTIGGTVHICTVSVCKVSVQTSLVAMPSAIASLDAMPDGTLVASACGGESLSWRTSPPRGAAMRSERDFVFTRIL